MVFMVWRRDDELRSENSSFRRTGVSRVFGEERFSISASWTTFRKISRLRLIWASHFLNATYKIFNLRSRKIRPRDYDNCILSLLTWDPACSWSFTPPPYIRQQFTCRLNGSLRQARIQIQKASRSLPFLAHLGDVPSVLCMSQVLDTAQSALLVTFKRHNCLFRVPSEARIIYET